jgi:O-antigen ligase
MARHAMTGASATYSMDKAALTRLADGLCVAVAMSLPWSTSATGILLALWALVLAPTLDWADLRRALATPAGALPVLLALFGALGTLWAEVSWLERWNGLESFLKLLAIPLLFAQFRRSERGPWVFGGYVAACLALLVATFLVRSVPFLAFVPLNGDHLLVKNAATQSGEFVLAIFGLLYLAAAAVERRQWPRLLLLSLAVLAMLADIFYAATGRTALVVMPVLIVLFAAKKLGRRGALALFAGVAVLAAAVWTSSPYLRERTLAVWIDVRQYEASNEQNSPGERIEFAKKSIAFVREAPLFGHGTGSIHVLFEKSAVGQTGARGSATTNPHNQTFAVAIQLGLAGAVVLWAMWIAHLMLFRGHGLAQWVGLVVVAQNVVGSLFNSHLFDFVQGWIYVVGVGVAGGMALKAGAATRAGPAAR